MQPLRKQRTLAEPVMVQGFGLWNSKDVCVELRPAAVDSGVVFVRHGDVPTTRLRAHVAQRIELPRRTSLASGGARVEMIEHVMAALAGLRIDNCEVWVNGTELPGLDGSSQAYVTAIDQAGIVEQRALRASLIVKSLIRLGSEENWIEARPCSTGRMTVNFHLDYGAGNFIGQQMLQLPITPESFRRELAPARTFLLQEEAEWVQTQGMCRRAGYQNVLVLGPEGPIENELRFKDECVRHKALDLVGDLALAGCDLAGHFIAYRSGHRLNAEMVRALLQEDAQVSDQRRTA